MGRGQGHGVATREGFRLLLASDFFKRAVIDRGSTPEVWGDLRKYNGEPVRILRQTGRIKTRRGGALENALAPRFKLHALRFQMLSPFQFTCIPLFSDAPPLLWAGPPTPISTIRTKGCCCSKRTSTRAAC
jgi:hypothetical protein